MRISDWSSDVCSSDLVTLVLVKKMAAVSIKNPGPVIPAEHLDRIFERFYRIDASRQRGTEGAGLGLAIAKSIVEAHGGEIRANSAIQATEFEISLPSIGCCHGERSEEHTSELQSLMRISYAVFCLKKKNTHQ